VQQVSSQISQLQDQINRLTTENVQEQVVEVEAKIAQLQSEIALLERDINRSTYNGRFPSLAPPELVARQAQLKSTLELYQQIYANLLVLGQPTSAGISDRLGGLQKTLELYQHIYLQLLASLEQVRLARLQNTPSIVQIDEAVVPGSPVRPVPLQAAMLGAAVGLMLAFGVAFAVEYLDDTLRSPSDVERILGLPVLGYIADIGKPGKPGILHVSVFPRSLIAEAFRNLRSGIELSEGERAPRTILVTSSRPGEGKTTIASNLAAVFAQSGRRVVLVDADLRCPSVHRMVGLPNRVGLSTLFRDSLKPEAVLKEPGGNSYGLQVITSGARPANPSELLGSEKMLHILAELHQKADIIVFDGPPMMVADAQVLATLVDAVLLILQPGKSPADEAKSTLTQLQRSGANVIGVVFNRVPKHSGHYYGGYRYYAAPAYKAYHQKGPVEYIPVAPPSRSAAIEPATRPNGHHSEKLTN
jgi:capsular exopolysaccharide synthesis family protein